jgi:CRISPR-associated protein Csd1
VIVLRLAELATRERLADDPAFERRAVSVVLRLRRDGSLASAKASHEPRSLLIPAQVRRTSAIAANFLCDVAEYALGQRTRAKLTERRVAAMHAAFRALIDEASAEAPDEGLRALLQFLSRPRAPVAVSAGERIAFALEGDEGLLHERPSVAAWWRRRYGARELRGAYRCIFTAQSLGEVRTHPAIQRIPGGHPAGASLISHNLPSVESYGWSSQANAPIEPGVVVAYTRALNFLLEGRSSRRIELTPTTALVFWSDEPHALVDQLAGYWISGRIAAITEPILAHTRVHLLALSGANARVVARGFEEMALGALSASLRRYRDEAALDLGDEIAIPAPRRLLLGCAAREDSSRVDPAQAMDLVRTVLMAAPVSRRLLTAAVTRCREEATVTIERAAIMKLWLIRRRTDGPTKESLMSLDPEQGCIGYLLGRAFALLESIDQRRRRGLLRQRHYRTASIRPAAVMPELLRAANTLAPQSDGDDLVRTLASLMMRVTEFPRLLSLEEQGRFALGYFHQRHAT